MEFSFFLVHPLPTSLAGSETIEFVGNILKASFVGIFMTDTVASKYYTLTRAWRQDAELYYLVDPCTVLTSERDLVFPETDRVEFEVLPIFLLKSLYSRLHLPPKLKEKVASETFTKLGKFLQETTIVRNQHYEDVHRDFFRLFC